jgi:hypothetical protein
MTTRKQLEVSGAAAVLGRKGGKARARNMSKTQRSNAAREAVAARWQKAHAHSNDCKLVHTVRYTPGCPGCLADARKLISENRSSK